MIKREPRDSDLQLDALYPEMPASFSQRIDDALLRVRSSRTYGKRRNNWRRQRGVMAACACAAAFVAICAATLFLPSLHAKREAQAAAKPDLPATTLTVELALPTQTAPAAGSTPEPEQPPEAQENAGTTAAIQERTPGVQAPTAAPTVRLERKEPVLQAADVTDDMVEYCAGRLLDWYCYALSNRSIPDTISLMDTNADTELWYYALELQIEQMNRSATAAETLQPAKDGVRLELSEWLNDKTLLATVRMRYESPDATMEEQVFLTLQLTDTGLRIVGFDSAGGSAWYDALKAAAEEEMHNGVERAEANVLAYKALSERLHSNMLFQWRNGALYSLLSAGESGADAALPGKEASKEEMETGWRVSVQELEELLGNDTMPILPFAAFLNYGVTILGDAVLPDSYIVYLYGDDSMLAEACRGTLAQVSAAFDSLPHGTYIVTFRVGVPAQTEYPAELATVSGAGKLPAATEAPAAAATGQPDAPATQTETDGENEAADTVAEWLFAFAVEY